MWRRVEESPLGKLTFGDDPAVIRSISRIQLDSWRAYESYTGVLGLQTLTNIGRRVAG